MSNIENEISFLEFAYRTMTEQQKFRVNMQYDLISCLKNKPNNVKKRHIYRAIAEKYCYQMERVEFIATHELREYLQNRPLHNENN
jgi:hypothetical protein